MAENISTGNGTGSRIRSLSNLIGNTPMLEIEFTWKGKPYRIYSKAEYLNLSGSIKDRMAIHIIREAYRRGKLKPGDRIIEATGGNSGIAISAVGRALGHPVTIFMPEWISNERKDLIRSLGADIVLISREEGGYPGSIKRSEEMAASDTHSFLAGQFENEDNISAHYNTTGPEIWWQLRFYGKTPDAFIAGVGTGGTIMGTGKFLREMNPSIKLYPLEPSNSPTMSTGYKVGPHRIQGISGEFVPSIVKLDSLNEVVAVDDGDSIIMAQKLAAGLGIGVGISSGANFLGAIKKLEELGPDATVVTVFSDDNKKYLSTGLMKTEPVKNGFISTDVKLTSFRVMRRSCVTCCNPDECEVVYNPEFVKEAILPPCFLKGRFNCCS